MEVSFRGVMDFQLCENRYKTNEPIQLETLILLNRPFLKMSENPNSIPNLKSKTRPFYQTFLILEYLIRIERKDHPKLLEELVYRSI